jgi:hypothetical protein
LYDKSVQIVTSTRRASISSLQRRLRIGYNRAARIIEDMEAAGVVSEKLALSDSTELKNSKNWLVLLLSLIAIFAHKAAIRINALIFIKEIVCFCH